MEMAGGKTNFDIWLHSFQDQTIYPSKWRRTWGQPIELWLITKQLCVQLFITKTHIIHRVNEDMFGRSPIWHVWNRRTDKRIYCGSSQKQAYFYYTQEAHKEAELL